MSARKVARACRVSSPITLSVNCSSPQVGNKSRFEKTKTACTARKSGRPSLRAWRNQGGRRVMRGGPFPIVAVEPARRQTLRVGKPSGSVVGGTATRPSTTLDGKFGIRSGAGFGAGGGNDSAKYSTASRTRRPLFSRSSISVVRARLPDRA